jgi:hypothetical protein
MLLSNAKQRFFVQSGYSRIPAASMAAGLVKGGCRA